MAGTTGLEPATSDVKICVQGQSNHGVTCFISSLRAPRSDTECHRMPKTIHSVHAYYTHIFIPEYLIRIIFRNLQLLHELPRNHRSRPGDPANRPWAGFTHSNFWSVDYCHLKAVLDTCKEPKGCRIRLSVAHRKRRGALTGFEHTSACLRPRKYCAAISGFSQIRPQVRTPGIIP